MNDAPESGKKVAGAFDVRVVVGSLMGIYAVILLLMGLFGDEAADKTGGVNANLYAGMGLVVLSVGFLGWARWRPIVVVPPNEDARDLEHPAPR
ncbi:hypothetical protein [Nocardioides taihuensis]|uniref:Cell division protein CrgA n=1 Tax=Nocardioides taihuensis TaxID=1835606 RepID=A0ABW0BL23_9ACTN